MDLGQGYSASPTRIIVESDSARLDGPLLSGRLIRISAVSGSPAPPVVARSPVVFLVATPR